MIAQVDQLEGVYLNLPREDYDAIPALNYSGMRKMRVSPLTYWEHYINPRRPAPVSTAAQAFGNAFHCRTLEPDEFSQRYARALRKANYIDVLTTMEDLKEFCATNGLKVTAKRKEELIERINLAGHNPPIWDSMVSKHAADNAGKHFLTAEEADTIEAMAEVINNDPEARSLLSDGQSEVTIVLRDPGSGVLLKCRIDYVKPLFNVDIKTFTNSKRKPVRQAAFDALYYDGYLGQAVFYHNMRETAVEMGIPGAKNLFGLPSAFTFLFIESESPHHLESIEIHPSEADLYWQSSVSFIQDCVATYANFLRRFGDREWREPVRPHLLRDADIRQLAYS